MKKYILNVLLMIPAYSFSQTELIKLNISGSINSKEFDNIELYKLGLPVSTHPTKYFIPIVNKTFQQDIELPSNCLYKLGDGFKGHTIFIDSDDSINLYLSIIPDLSKRRAKGEYVSKFHSLSVKARYPGNFLFFDDLEEKIGIIRYGNSEADKDKAIEYKKRCDSALTIAITLLGEYKAKDLISEKFYALAKADIEYKYILRLCDILPNLERKTLPANFFENLSNIKFDDADLIYKSDNFIIAASVFNIYYLNEFNPYNQYANLESKYQSASSFFNGLIRDKVIARLLIENKTREHLKFDSLYLDFQSLCKDSAILENTMADINVYKNSRKPKPEIKEILNTILLDLEGKSHTLKDLTDKHPFIIIDCWATWCVPCIKQMEFITEFEKKYNESVLFLHLSIDTDFKKWKKYISTQKKGNKIDFLIDKYQFTAFYNFFELVSIPRFIFLKTNGELLTAKDMPIPELKKSFEKFILDNLPSQNQK